CTISALNSGVNDRRGRGFFFATVSILDILSGALAHLVDVRQTVPIPSVSLALACGDRLAPPPPSGPALRRLGRTGACVPEVVAQNVLAG
ncbi:MAG TPA: hypothetical protein VHT75_18735, partial [Acidimicrobiales bacterium]|nr:hypothetical protein [Acidimicrobiales bacterium]